MKDNEQPIPPSIPIRTRQRALVLEAQSSPTTSKPPFTKYPPDPTDDTKIESEILPTAPTVTVIIFQKAQTQIRSNLSNKALLKSESTVQGCSRLTRKHVRNNSCGSSSQHSPQHLEALHAAMFCGCQVQRHANFAHTASPTTADHVSHQCSTFVWTRTLRQ